MKRVKASIRVTDADSLSDVLVRLYKNEVATNPAGAIARDANLAVMMGEIEQLSAQMTTAIKRDKVVTNLDEMDGKRCDLIRQLGTLLSGYCAIPTPDKQEAAKKLSATFDKYGKAIVNETYARKSSLIESMLEDFGADALRESVLMLEGVSDLISGLRQAQDVFFEARDSAMAAQTNRGESASSIKKPLIASINDHLVPYLTGLANMPEYKDWVAICDAEVMKTNAAAQKRTKQPEPIPEEKE